MLHYLQLIFQIGKATMKCFRYVLFKMNKITTKLKICYGNISMFTSAKPKKRQCFSQKILLEGQSGPWRLALGANLFTKGPIDNNWYKNSRQMQMSGRQILV